jgi:hypothetical protein
VVLSVGIRSFNPLGVLGKEDPTKVRCRNVTAAVAVAVAMTYLWSVIVNTD